MDAVNIQTKFGLGEIVTTHQRRKGNQMFGEDELIGDPDYDQEKGGYTDAAV